MKKTLEVINELKKEGLINDYAIGGAVGALRWTEPFFTEDLDIFGYIYCYRARAKRERLGRFISLVSPMISFIGNNGMFE